MPSRYRRDAARLKAEIVSRVAAGETVRAVSGGADMPSVQAVRNWAKADAAFGAALAEAQARRIARQLAFDPVRAEAFLAAARAGASVHTLFGKPGMPKRGEFYRWKRTHPAFAAATAWLVARRDAQLSELCRGRRRDFDPVVADRIVAAAPKGRREGLGIEDVLAADPDAPCWDTLMRWRREVPAFDVAMRAALGRRLRAPVARRGPAAMKTAVTQAIWMGATFTTLDRRADMPSRGTLGRWTRGDADFAAAVTKACDVRERWLTELFLDAAGNWRSRSLGELRAAAGHIARRLGKPWLWPGVQRRRQWGA
jgi:hypothetical protein